MIEKLQDTLDISVIIPTCFRSVEAVQKCLHSLAKQSFSQERFEVILIDDGTKDKGRSEIEPLLNSLFKNSLYLWKESGGQGPARNLAIEKSKGRILLILNDDAISIPELLEEHYQEHQNHKDLGDVILGKFTVSPELPYSMFAKMHSDLSYGSFEGKDELDWRAFYTCNISVKKDFLLKHGMFDDELRYYEDVELGERLSHHGLRIFYRPEILAYHYHFLGEEHFLGYAPFHSKVLVDWYKKSPHLAHEMVRYGFYPADNNRNKFKDFIWRIIVNPITIPFHKWIARKIAKLNEELSLKIYKRVFDSITKRTIREEMRKSN